MSSIRATNKRQIELHLSSDAELVTKFGKKIKALGGHYSECRGHYTTRFVHLPWTPAGRELAQKLLDTYPDHYTKKTSVVILRNFPRIDDTVYKGSSLVEALEKLRVNARKLKAMGVLKPVKSAAERHAEALETARKTVEHFRTSLATAEKQLAALEAKKV